MTPEHKETFAFLFERWFCGNRDAMQACLDLLEIAHLWDDLLDGDRALDAERSSDVVRKALLDLPTNPFWAANIRTLQPVLFSVYLQWHAANVMEDDDRDEDQPKAYMLRASVYQVFSVVALLCGGMEWAKQMSPEIWRAYGESVPTFSVIDGGKKDA